MKDNFFYISKIKEIFNFLDQDDLSMACKKVDNLKKEYKEIDNDLFGILVRIESYLSKTENLSLNDIKSEFNDVVLNKKMGS